GAALENYYNKQNERLTFAWPIGATMAELFNRIGWFDHVLALVAVLVAVVSVAAVLAGIYNSMNERRRQIAILRALGARRITVAAIVVLEAAAIGMLGVILGFAVYGAIVESAARIIRAQTGVVLHAWVWHSVLLWAPLLLVGLSALAGL